MFRSILNRVLAALTIQRLTAQLVIIVGAFVGAYAARGMTPVQWAGALVAVGAAITLAVVVHRSPAPAKARARIR
jgi:hypothetical protein